MARVAGGHAGQMKASAIIRCMERQRLRYLPVLRAALAERDRRLWRSCRSDADGAPDHSGNAKFKDRAAQQAPRLMVSTPCATLSVLGSFTGGCACRQTQAILAVRPSRLRLGNASPQLDARSSAWPHVRNKSHLERKRDVIATIAAAPAAPASWHLSDTSDAGGMIGGLIGVALARSPPHGRSAPWFVRWTVGELALALLYGLRLAFALWPLGRAHDVPANCSRPGARSRARLPWRGRYCAAGRARARLRTSTHGVGRVCGSCGHVFGPCPPSARSTALALAECWWWSSASRLLVTVIEIEQPWPSGKSASYFLDIPAADSTFEAFVRTQAPGSAQGSCAEGIPVDKLKPSDAAAWVLKQCGITSAVAQTCLRLVRAGTQLPKRHSSPSRNAWPRRRLAPVTGQRSPRKARIACGWCRLAKPRHGLFAARFRRRAGPRFTYADSPGDLLARGRRQVSVRTTMRRNHHQSGGNRHFLRRCWCWRCALRPTAAGLRRGNPEQHHRLRLIGAYALEYLLLGTARLQRAFGLALGLVSPS